MTSLLEGKIAKMVASGLKAANIPYALTLSRDVPGSTAPPYSPHSPADNANLLGVGICR